MSEYHTLTDRQQSVRCRGHRRRGYPESVRRPHQQPRVAQRVPCPGQQQTPRIIWERLESLDEALLDPSRQLLPLVRSEATGHLGRNQLTRQLEQGKRVAPRLDEDLLAQLLVELEPHCRAQQRTRVGFKQARPLQAG